MTTTTGLSAPEATCADLLWPRKPGLAGAVRAGALAIGGACLLTVSAKVAVPGPVNMTLQTLVVLLLGAALGWRVGLAAVLAYLAEGALGLSVFTNTPPLPAGPGYFMGPTGGFLAGFVVAAVIVGVAADRGLPRRPILFAAVLAGADLVLLLCGWAWLAYGTPMHGGFGLGPAKAFAVGVQPFWLGEAIKVGLAAALVPAGLDALRRLRG